MNDTRETALTYFRPHKNYFWRWAEKGAVIEDAAGYTICYGEDLAALLRRLAGQGLPPFGTLLLLLAAGHRDWQARGRQQLLELLSRLLQQFAGSGQPQKLQQYTLGAVAFLDRVHALPPELRSGNGRAQLFSVFLSAASSQTMDPEAATRLVAEWDSGRLDASLFTGARAPKEITEQVFLQDLTGLYNAFIVFPDRETLEHRIRTGLDKAPEPAEIGLPQKEGADWRTELEADPRTAGLSRLARHLEAALHIPMHAHGSGDQPLGGVSDITNRGNYDRLLLSELAHDDLSLVARLANNEALFLRREEPPAPDNRTRTLLVDTSLKMWGTPRVFALAAALALGRNTGRGTTVQAYALGGTTVEALDLQSKEGVLRALERLDPALHCTVALAAFLKDSDLPQTSQTVLITGEGADLHLQAAPELQQRLSFLLTVGRQGRLELYELVEGRRKRVTSALLDLDELLFAPVAPASTQQKSPPAFMRQPASPLYFPTARVRVQPDQAWHHPDLGVVVVTQDQRVLHWPQKDKGAREIIPFIEAGQYSLGPVGKTGWCLAVSQAAGTRLRLYSQATQNAPWDSCDLSQKISDTEEVKKIVFDGMTPAVFVQLSRRVLSVDPVQGTVRDCQAHKDWRPLAGVAPLPVYEASCIRKYIQKGYSVLTRIQELYIDHNQQLCLDHRALRPVSGALKLMTRDGATVKKTEPLADEPVTLEGYADPRMSFRRLSWADGSEILLDPRGFLHLRSSNAALPEMTLTLIVDKPLAAWAADGTCTGNHYFRAAGQQLEPAEFYKKYLSPFIAQLQ
ncbi:hypothetical protein V9K67_13970 [Paraflavisolibacter sp. H34]|uniref:hypothetical protein n=1 Tax=Huijunlia imazamoxiresistens TaxID=3127457 RepID=UPI003017E674